MTSLFLLHPEIMQILKYDYSTFSDTRSLEVLAISGSSLPKDKLIEVKYVFPNTRIFQMYAMTEAGGPVTFFNLKDNYHLFILHNYPSTCGKPLPGFSYRVRWKLKRLNDRTTVNALIKLFDSAYYWCF